MSQAGVTEEMREQIDVTRAEKRHAGGGRETREEGDVRRGSCGRRERWEEEEDKRKIALIFQGTVSQNICK